MWRENMLGYLSGDKYPSIFSRQMKAISETLQNIFTTSLYSKTKYLEFGLSLDITNGGNRSECWVRVVPAHNGQSSRRQFLRGLGLGYRIHFTLQSCAQTPTRYCLGNLMKQQRKITGTIYQSITHAYRK